MFAAIFTAQTLVSACAEIEVTAEIIKRTGKAIDADKPAAEVELAQADAAPIIQAASSSPTGVSPLLEPAPQVFERTGTVNWDGKRTLQGIWVAHPDAQIARRVRIFNDQTGLAVDGALFKRDGTLGDVDTLISSQAAEQLALIPGVETQLRIVAVRPVQRSAAATSTEEEPDQATDPVELVEDDVTPTPVPAITEPEPEPEPEISVAAITPVEETPAIAELTQQPVAEEPPQIALRTEADAAEAYKTDVNEAETPETAVVLPVARATPPKLQQEQATAPTEPKPKPVIGQAGSAEFKWETPSEPASNGATEAPARDEPKQEIARAAPAKENTKPQDTAKRSGTLVRPFVQAGIFGVPENASKLVRQLKDRGVPAKALAVRSNSSLLRVLAGPFTDRAKRDAAQKIIRGLGLRDAVPVSR